MTTAKKNQGVTLIELMIAIAVVAILAVIALPSFERTLERRRLVGAAENLFGALQYARSEAIKQNRLIAIDVDDGTTWCYGIDYDDGDADATDGDDGAGCDCNTPATCTINGVQKVTSSGEYLGITLDSSVTSVSFDPMRGTVGTAATFEFESPHGDEKQVDLTLLGSVKVN